jgi:hypothetical protein
MICSFGEDQSQARTGNAAENLAALLFYLTCLPLKASFS